MKVSIKIQYERGVLVSEPIFNIKVVRIINRDQCSIQYDDDLSYLKESALCRDIAIYSRFWSEPEIASLMIYFGIFSA